MSNRRSSYDAAFKLKVVSMALESKNNRKTADHFGINEKQVRQWIRAKDQLYSSKRRAKRLPGVGCKVKNISLDENFMQWFDGHRKNGNAISGRQLQMQARRITTDGTFKASDGWLHSFKKRHALSTRVLTSIGQKLPPNFEDKIEQFHRYIIQLRQRHGYPLSDVYNMDETLLRFDMPSI
uniref:Pogo transposable element with KRAB domain-like n=1 Tax=Saccoglossus kowalevskii TaxID=10224 RepID=A0ABM0LUE5_SACKO|nr:PREDICTED: pogo transposable element with KRAB domain-like [Saccoglossus kowalevskii]